MTEFEIFTELEADMKARLFTEGRSYPVLSDYEAMLPDFIDRTGKTIAEARSLFIDYCGGAVAPRVW